MDLASLKKNTTGHGPNVMENLVVKVEEYKPKGERPSVIGTRLDTGDKVEVFLRDLKDDSKLKKPRPTVADFASGPRDAKVSTEVGGIIRFDGCFPVKGEEGVYSARWAQSLSHTPSEAQVIIGMARVYPPKTDGSQVRQAAEVLRVEDAMVASSEDELVEAIKTALASEAPGTPGAYLRVAVGADTFVTRLSASFSRDEAGELLSMDPPSVAFGKWAETEIAKKFLTEFRKEPVPVEVIPMSRMNLGFDTVTNTANTPHSLELKFKTDDGFSGVAPASVVVRTRENGSVFITDIAPLKTDQAVFKLDSVPTPNVSKPAAPKIDPTLPVDDDAEFDGAEVGPGAPAPDPLANLDASARRSSSRRP